MVEKTLPKLPNLILARTMQLREDLNRNVIAKYEGRRLTGDAFLDFVHELHDKMPRVPFHTLFNSVQHLAGILITSEVNQELAWRLAGNQHYLRKSLVIPPYTRQLFPEWVAVQVWDTTRSMKVYWIGDKKNENKVLGPAVELDLMVLVGSSAGRHFTKFFREKLLLRKEVKTMLGFSHYDKRLYNRYFVGENNYPLDDMRQLVKLRFFVYVDPVDSKAGELCYSEMGCSGAMRTWNRDLMKRRQRQSVPCPKGYDLATVPCHTCEIGFDACRAGCHPTAYLKQYCTNCNQDAWFANSDAKWCVDCLAKNA